MPRIFWSSGFVFHIPEPASLPSGRQETTFTAGISTMYIILIILLDIMYSTIWDVHEVKGYAWISRRKAVKPSFAFAQDENQVLHCVQDDNSSVLLRSTGNYCHPEERSDEGSGTKKLSLKAAITIPEFFPLLFPPQKFCTLNTAKILKNNV